MWSANAKIGLLFLKLEVRDRNHFEYGKGMQDDQNHGSSKPATTELAFYRPGRLYLKILKGLLNLFRQK